MKYFQQGFTLIELMMVVAIIGLLASIAIPSYQDFVIRAKVTEGLSIVSATKAVVSDFYYTNNVLPADNTAAGLALAGSYATTYIQDLTINAGTITVDFLAATGNGITDGDSIAFVPTATGTGAMEWSCNGAGSDLPSKFRPANCR